MDGGEEEVGQERWPGVIWICRLRWKSLRVVMGLACKAGWTARRWATVRGGHTPGGREGGVGGAGEPGGVARPCRGRPVGEASDDGVEREKTSWRCKLRGGPQEGTGHGARRGEERHRAACGSQGRYLPGDAWGWAGPVQVASSPTHTQALHAANQSVNNTCGAACAMGYEKVLLLRRTAKKSAGGAAGAVLSSSLLFAVQFPRPKSKGSGCSHFVWSLDGGSVYQEPQ